MDYKRRTERVKDELVERGVDAYVVVGGPNSRYLTGFNSVAERDYPVVMVPAEGEPKLYVSKLDEEVALEKASADVNVPEGSTAEEIGESIDGEVLLDPHASISFLRGLNDVVDVEIEDELVYGLRMIKDDEEVERIREAYRIAEAALENVMEDREGRNEREIAAQLEYVMRVNGSGGVAFPTIVGSGPSSAAPHHTSSDRDIGEGPLLLDLGGMVGGYRSDMTRTLHVGESGEGFMEVYETVREAQERAASRIREGVDIKEVDAAARNFIEEEGYGDLFIHSTGHGVGLDVHERPGISGDSEEELESGMVITVEPGIYVPGEFGVRIEDAFLVTEEGSERITELDRDLEEL